MPLLAFAMPLFAQAWDAPPPSLRTSLSRRHSSEAPAVAAAGDHSSQRLRLARLAQAIPQIKVWAGAWTLWARDQEGKESSSKHLLSVCLETRT